jgi:hypothetical protein
VGANEPKLDLLSRPDAQGRRVVDLLAVAEPNNPWAAGNWSRTSDGIVSEPNAAECAALPLPYSPPAEYDLTVRFTRTDGKGDVQQMLAHGGTRFGYEIDSFDTRIGFQTVGGDDRVLGAAQVARVAPSSNGVPHVSIIRVRNGSLSSWLDGERIIEYKTSYQELRPRGEWDLGAPLLGVGAWKSRVVFHSIEVTEVSGPGTPRLFPAKPPGLVGGIFGKDKATQLRFGPERKLFCFFDHGRTSDVPAAWFDAVTQEVAWIASPWVFWMDRFDTRRYINAASPTDRTHLFDVETDRDLNEIEGPAKVQIGTFSPDGARLAIWRGGWQGTPFELSIHDALTGRRLALVREGAKGVEALPLAFSDDGRTLYFIDADETACAWDVDRNRSLWRAQTGGTRFGALTQAPAGRRILISPEAAGLWHHRTWPHLTVLDATTGATAAVLENLGDVHAAAITSDGRSVLAGRRGMGICLQLYDLDTGKSLNRFAEPTGTVMSVAISPDGRTALAGCEDGCVRLFDLGSGAQLARFDGHLGPVLCVAFSDDGKLAASGGSDRAARVWRLPDMGLRPGK